MSEFNTNPQFAKFLYMAKNDSDFAASLSDGRKDAIQAFPGLSDREKETLEVVDWQTVEIDVPEDILQDFRPNVAARICKESIGPSWATKKCTWRTIDQLERRLQLEDEIQDIEQL